MYIKFSENFFPYNIYHKVHNSPLNYLLKYMHVNYSNGKATCVDLYQIIPSGLEQSDLD